MTTQEWMRYFKQAPTVVQDYFLDQRSVDDEAAARTKLAYDTDAWERVMDVVWDVVFAKHDKADFESRLRPLAGDRLIEDVERALLFHVVLPLSDLVTWDVEARLQELGVSMGEIQNISRISLRPVSYGAAVRRIATQAKISLLGEEVVRRLREIVVSNIKGIRTIEQMKEVMQRKQAEGGLGFTMDQANAFVTTMQDFFVTTQVMSEEEYADWFAKFQREEKEKPLETTEPISQEPTKELTPEEAEIEAIRAQLPTMANAKTALDKAIATALERIALPNLDPYLLKRLQNTISTRFRDVRNAFQVQSILTRNPEVGGVGLDASEAERISSVIEQVYAEQREGILGEEKKLIEDTLSAQKQKVEERRKRESEEHAQWFEDKQRALGVVASKGPTSQVRLSPTTLTQPAVPLIGSGQAPISASTNRGYQRVDFSQPTMEAPVTMGTMDDVRGPVRLTGLDEELGGLGLAEFRRMGKDPSSAAEKIFQKLETLKRESFERWTDGVQSWRGSPLQQIYLKLVVDSFGEGKPVAEVLEAKRKTNPNLPTAEELGAIIELNNRIHL